MAGRGQFARASSTAGLQTPDEAAWRGMRFMVFDMPAHGGPFTERITAFNAVVAQIHQPWVVAVVQARATTHTALLAQMHRVARAGGEGLVLHRGASLYTAARNDDLLKVKPHEDAEARACWATRPGAASTPACWAPCWWKAYPAAMPQQPACVSRSAPACRMPSAAIRPPVVGRVVTYRFRGLTDAGVPRFASFVRAVASDPSESVAK